MSPQVISITHSALGWVKKSIDDNLSEITSDLRRYIESRDQTIPEGVKQRLAMIQGVLVMIEQYGAAMLTEEMVALVDFVVETGQEEGDQALEVLLRAVLQLPDYLEHIQSGHRDIPIAILPLLNDIRAVRNQDLFSEKLLFLPDLSMHEEAAESESIDDKSNQAMRLLVKKLRPAYQLALVNVIRERDIEASLHRLERICATLEERSASEQVARIWWIIGALIESVSRQQLELGVSVKNLLGKVDALFRVILIIGERGLLQRQPIELIKNFLYYIAQPECDGPKTQAIKTAYRLEQFLPSESARSKVLSNIAGPNQALLKTVAEAMKADIETVKSTLEVYVNGDLSQIEALKDLPQEMHIISDTLAMIGLGPQRQLIETQIEVVKQILDGEVVADEPKLLSMAAELLQVEQALDQMQRRQPVDSEQSRSETDVSHDYELDGVLSSVVTATLDNVQKTKDAILEFVKDPERTDNIELCINLMGESRGALMLLDQPHAVSVIDGLVKYLQDFDTAAFVEADQLDSMSQVVASLEYYLEALGERRSDADRILDMADSRLRQLLFRADKNTANAKSASQAAEQASRRAQAEAQAATDAAADSITVSPTAAAQEPEVQDEAPASKDFDDTVVVDGGAAGGVTGDVPTQVIESVNRPGSERDTASTFDDTVVVDNPVDADIQGFEDAPTQVLRPAPSSTDQPASAGPAAGVDERRAPEVEPVDEALEVLKSGSDPEILEIYLEEAAEESANIARLQQDWLLHPGDENALRNIRRAFHTIKGSGRLVGATKIGEFAWDFEQLLNRVIDKTVPPDKQVINAVGGAARALPELVQELTTFEEPRADIAYLRGLARTLAEFKTEQLLVDHTQTLSMVESPYDHITDSDSDFGDEETQVIDSGFGSTTQIIPSGSSLPLDAPDVQNVSTDSKTHADAGDLGETRPGDEYATVVDEAVTTEANEDLSKYDNTELTEAPPVPDMEELRRAEVEARKKIAAAARARADASYERAPDYTQAQVEADDPDGISVDDQGVAGSSTDAGEDLSKYDNTELTEAPPIPDMEELRRAEVEARKKIAAAARARADASYERAPDYTQAQVEADDPDGISVDDQGVAGSSTDAGEDLSKYDNTELTEAPPIPDMEELRRAEVEARKKIAAAARARADASYERAPDYTQAQVEADDPDGISVDDQGVAGSSTDAGEDLSKYDNTELTEAPPIPDMEELRRAEVEARKKIAAAARARADATYERAADYAGTESEAEETAGEDGHSIDTASTGADKIVVESMGDDFVGAGLVDELADQQAIDSLPPLSSLGENDNSLTARVDESQSVEVADAVSDDAPNFDARSEEIVMESPLGQENIEMAPLAAENEPELTLESFAGLESEEIEMTSAAESDDDEIEMTSPAELEVDEIEMTSPSELEVDEIEMTSPSEPEVDEIEMTSPSEPEVDEIEMSSPSEPEFDELEMPSLAEPELDEIEMISPADPKPADSRVVVSETTQDDETRTRVDKEVEQLRRDPPDPFVKKTATSASGVAAEASGSRVPERPEPTGLSFDPELLTIYQQEVEQHLSTVSSALDHAEKIRELVPGEALYRALHTIHGASRTADIVSIGELAELLEKPLKTAIGQNMALDHEIVALYREGERVLRSMTQELVATRCLPQIPDDLETSLRALAEDFEEYTVDLTEGGPDQSGSFIDTLTMMNDSADDEQDDELLDIFVDEANELLEMSDITLHQWTQQNPEEPGAQDYAAVMELQRYLHTLKGGARMAELKPISDLSHEMESLFIAVIDGRANKTGRLIDALRDSFDLLHQQVTQAQQSEAMTSAESMIENLRNLRFEEDESGRAESADNAAGLDVDSESIDIVSENLPGVSASELDRPGQDVIKVRADLLDNLVSSAGEVSIYRARMEQQVAGLGSHLGELAQTITRLKSQLRSLEAETDAQIHFSHRTEQQHAGDFDPLEMDRYTLIQELSRSLGESVNDLSSLQGMLGEQVRDSETLLLQQSRVSTDLQDGLIKSRMVRFSGLLTRLRRLVRQSSQELGKKAELAVTGEQNEVDNKVLDRMVAPLEHIIRNALSHGIETPVERVRKGKPETGKIAIDITRDGSDVVLRVSDDGAGVNIEKVRHRAIQLGMLEQGHEVSDSDLVQFILEPGFSTAEHVTQLSGRGVGMDVVDIEVKQLGGTLQIESTPQGTTFVARLPFTLSINQAILVRCGEETYAIPLLNIEGITRIDAQQMHEYYRQESPQIEYAGQGFALHNLAKLVGAEELFRPDEEEKQPIILSRAGDIRVALHVDEILGNREIVVKNLGKQLSQVKSLAGASILADGSMVLILDIGGVIRQQVGSAVKVVYQAAPDHAVKLQNTVMVVDDSITMRRVASKLLERHNYEVITAKDGVDALAQLQDVRPDVILLDIEMPRMDGFELASHMRNEASFSQIPIIMITSRTGEKHRDRAFEIGVTNYMGKPYQEAELIENIQSALGGR